MFVRPHLCKSIRCRCCNSDKDFRLSASSCRKDSFSIEIRCRDDENSLLSVRNSFSGFESFPSSCRLSSRRKIADKESLQREREREYTEKVRERSNEKYGCQKNFWGEKLGKKKNLLSYPKEGMEDEDD